MELHEFLEQEEQTEQEQFTVDTDEKANWALRKIRQYQEQRKENIALAEAEIHKIEAWLESENEKVQDSIDYFQGLLGEYAMKKREQDPKFKSQKLPYGKIKFVKQQPKWNYKDDELVQSLKEVGQTEYVKVKESPDKAKIKKSFQVQDGKVIDPETGAIINGVTVEEREDAFKVEVDD